MQLAMALVRTVCGLAVCAAAVLSARQLAPLAGLQALQAAGGFVQNPAAAVYAARAAARQDQAPADPAEPAASPAAPTAAPADSAPQNAETAPAAAPLPEQPQEEPWDGVVPEGALPVTETQYPQGSSEVYLPVGAGSIKNCTGLSNADLAGTIAQGMPFAIQANSAEPQVLVMHTHTTESYLTENSHYVSADWGGRTTNEAQNVCAVGQALADALNAAGVNTLHDTTLHDYPSYNGSYERSNQTVRALLEQYPSIRVVLDVHRDAIERDGALVAPVAQVQGQRVAQVMLICGCDKNGNLPNFRQNLRFAAAWEQTMEGLYPGLTRPVLFDYRYYNQDLTTGSLLIEVGGHGNTLAQAVAAGQLAGQALAALLLGQAP